MIHKQYEQPPIFIAVEWDVAIFSAVRHQRSLFRNLLLEKRSQLPSYDFEQLVKSLGYEGDTHRDIFPETTTLWLETGCEAETARDPHRITHYAQHRCDLLNKRIGFSNDLDGKPRLELLSKQLWSEGSARCTDERDGAWTKMVVERIRSGEVLSNNVAKWGFCVVGAGHLDDCPECFVYRLKKCGVEVETRILRPSLV